MSELAENFKEMRENSKVKRAKNLFRSTEIVKESGVKFEVKNGGYHLVVDDRYDFYPSTGMFIERKTRKTGRGVFKLLEKMKEGK